MTNLVEGVTGQGGVKISGTVLGWHQANSRAGRLRALIPSKRNCVMVLFGSDLVDAALAAALSPLGYNPYLQRI